MRIAWSPDGRLIASSSRDGVVYVWDVAENKTIGRLQNDSGVDSIAWAPDGQRLAVGCQKGGFRVWAVASNKILGTFGDGNEGEVLCLAWSANGNALASGQGEILRVWNTETWKSRQIAQAGGHFWDLTWSPDDRALAAACTDNRVRLWTTADLGSYRTLEGHSEGVTNVAFSPDGQVLASASEDQTVRIWAADTGQELVVLEGHTRAVTSVSFSSGGAFLASKSQDKTVRLWRRDNWSTVATFNEPTDNECVFFATIAFHPKRNNVLATFGENDTVIRIWELDRDRLLSQRAAPSVRYTTAKVVLVGDSGVGKTGLGWRLAHDEFREHASTHGQQFWVIDQLRATLADGTECEAVLWDLAGQHVYRPVHAIFLEDVDAALVLFDPTNRQEPLKGVQFWLKQLAGREQLPPALLIGARADRGTSVLSQQDLEQFCARYGVTGGYLATSAKSGNGVDRLLEALRQQIRWDRMTSTVTTVTFKRIKEYVLALKAQPDRAGVLVSPTELRERLEATNPSWRFSDAEMMTAMKHLENHGYVTMLLGSSGAKSVLLTPDLLVDLASSVVLQADKHPRELGALSETDLLHGNYPLPELADLGRQEQEILLDAAIARFVNHNICFRESLGAEALLIFPGLIKQKRPLLEETEIIEDISYVVRGRIENVYSALVVLLGYTQTFTRVNQWKNQAQYELGKGEICGFRLIEEHEGEIELVLYHNPAMPPFGLAMFQGLFEQFLYQRDVDVTPFPPVICPNGHRQERATVVRRVRENKTSTFCDECGAKVGLPEAGATGIPDGWSAEWIQREEALARLRSTYETYLVRVKGYRRDRAAPRCYLSHVPEQRQWVAELAQDLREAGVIVLEDLAQVQDSDALLIVSTPAYRRAWNSPDGAIKAASELIRRRLGDTRELAGRTLELRLEDDARTSPPRDPDQRSLNDFRDETYYPVNLFDLVLTLYAIRIDHPAFRAMRKGLRQQWVQRLGALEEHKGRSWPPRLLNIFISYAHEDEPFKDALITMLTGLQRRGVINAWHDRRIEEGDEWRASIEDATNRCDLALLLVSSDFLASRFIADHELPRLLQRREEQGLRVVPIIVRPCLWRNEPVLQDLQALPKDGKAVITFPADTGERDQAWADICAAIEARVTEMAGMRQR